MYTVVLLVITLISFLLQSVIKRENVGNVWFYSINSFMLAVVFFIISFISRKKFGINFGVKKFSPLFILYALMIGLGMIFGLGFVNDGITRFIESIGGTVARSYIAANTLPEYIIYSVTVCALPAVSEELFFRGTLLNAFDKKDQLTAVFVTAFCFALYHLNVAQFAYQFIYGILLGVMTVSAKSIIPAIVAHFINNFTVITFQFFGIAVDLYNLFIIAAGILCLAVFTAIILIAFIKVILIAGHRRSEKEKGDKYGNFGGLKDFYIPFGIFGTLFAVIVIILSVIPMQGA